MVHFVSHLFLVPAIKQSQKENMHWSHLHVQWSCWSHWILWLVDIQINACHVKPSMLPYLLESTINHLGGGGAVEDFHKHFLSSAKLGDTSIYVWWHPFVCTLQVSPAWNSLKKKKSPNRQIMTRHFWPFWDVYYSDNRRRLFYGSLLIGMPPPLSSAWLLVDPFSCHICSEQQM